jgi:hypothetical protein
MSMICSICLDQVDMKMGVTTLSCGHQYHIACCIPWLTSNTTCPNCRSKLGPHETPVFYKRRRSYTTILNTYGIYYTPYVFDVVSRLSIDHEPAFMKVFIPIRYIQALWRGYRVRKYITAKYLTSVLDVTCARPS